MPKPEVAPPKPLAPAPGSKPQPQPINSQPTPVRQSPFRYLIPLLGLVLVGGIVFFLVKNILPRLIGGGQNQGAVEITYWGLWEPSEVLQTVFADFESQNPGIKVNYQQEKSQDYRERLQTALTGNTGPDVFRYHLSWVPMLQNLMAPVPKDIYSDSAFAQTFYPSAAKWLKSSRGYLGIPLEVDGLGLYYNKSIFTAAGKTPPTSWEELRRTAKQLTVMQGEQIQRAGVALGTTSNVDHWSDIVGVMLLQNAADPAHPNNKNGQDALTFYTLFTTLDHVWDESLPPSTYAFATEKVAMMIAPSWRAFDIRQQNPELDFAIAPLPQLPDTQINWASYWVEGVSNKSSNAKQAAAWKLLNYLSQKDTLRQLYAQASNVRLFGEPFSRLDMADQLQNDPYVGAIINTAPTAQTWYLNSFTHDNGLNDGMSKYYLDAVNSILGGTSATAALTTAEAGITQVAGRYNLKI